MLRVVPIKWSMWVGAAQSFPISNSSSLCCELLLCDLCLRVLIISKDLHFSETPQPTLCLYRYGNADKHTVTLCFCRPAGSPRFDRPYWTPWWARREGRQRSAWTPRFSWWQGWQCKWWMTPFHCRCPRHFPLYFLPFLPTFALTLWSPADD